MCSLSVAAWRYANTRVRMTALKLSEPPPDPLLADVIRPLLSTVMFAFV